MAYQSTRRQHGAAGGLSLDLGGIAGALYRVGDKGKMPTPEANPNYINPEDVPLTNASVNPLLSVDPETYRRQMTERAYSPSNMPFKSDYGQQNMEAYLQNQRNRNALSLQTNAAQIARDKTIFDNAAEINKAADMVLANQGFKPTDPGYEEARAQARTSALNTLLAGGKATQSGAALTTAKNTTGLNIENATSGDQLGLAKQQARAKNEDYPYTRAGDIAEQAARPVEATNKAWQSGFRELAPGASTMRLNPDTANTSLITAPSTQQMQMAALSKQPSPQPSVSPFTNFGGTVKIGGKEIPTTSNKTLSSILHPNTSFGGGPKPLGNDGTSNTPGNFDPAVGARGLKSATPDTGIDDRINKTSTQTPDQIQIEQTDQPLTGIIPQAFQNIKQAPLGQAVQAAIPFGGSINQGIQAAKEIPGDVMDTIRNYGNEWWKKYITGENQPIRY